MRHSVLGCLVLLTVLTGCASRLVDIPPDEEAVYDRPVEEVWPLVRAYFQANGFTFRQSPDKTMLQTEWREEFVGSRVSAYWHRYLVIAQPDGPQRCRILITRHARSINKALQAAGSELLWGVDSRRPGEPNDNLFGSSTGMLLAEQQGDDNAVIVGSSQQRTRDLALEWKVFRKISPQLAHLDQASPGGPDVAGLRDSSLECGVPIAGLGQVARPGHVVLLGELHGTQEIPHFVARSACQGATQGLPVTVGLELPMNHQERLDAFLASPGDEADWAKLMSGAFWRSPYPDGRGSEAVTDLLEALRELRAQGQDVRVFAYDSPQLEGDAREEAMARKVEDVAAASPGRVLLVLSGNLHPRQLQGRPRNKDYQPMGLRLARGRRDVYSLDVAYKNGTAWICVLNAEQKLECGEKPARGHDLGDRPFVQLFKGLNSEGYQGFFYVGAVSASPPAVFNGVEPAGTRHSQARP